MSSVGYVAGLRYLGKTLLHMFRGELIVASLQAQDWTQLEDRHVPKSRGAQRPGMPNYYH